MKNLVLLGERRRGVNLPEDDSGKHIVDICHVLSEDAYSETATVVLTNNGLLSKMSENGDISWTCNLEELKSGGGWFNVSFNDPELVCLSKNGAIISVSPATGQAELVGVFDYGLKAAAWSPDGEVLLMVTSSEDDEDETQIKSVLISMNTQFEVLAEVTIPKFVDEGKISVAWRPDGTLCALSSEDAEDGTRKVRMYKRETLELHAIGRSEDASGSLVRNLQNSGLSWASAGCSQLLASVQRKGKKTHQIVFFESNGLRHREFLLREAPTTDVTALTWNVDSDLLAVALREEGGDKIQLWHRCNYHWYMKREFQYPGQQVVGIKFDVEKSSDFYVLLNGLEWREYEIRWDPSTTCTFEGKCPAFVVDGCSLNITPLEKALIPPPMSMFSSTMAFPICEAFFCYSGDRSGSVLARLSDGSLILLPKNVDGGFQLFSNPLKVSWGSSNGFDLLSLRSFVVVHEEQSKIQLVAISCAAKNEDCEKLVEIVVSGLDTSEPVADIVNDITMEGQILRMTRWADSITGCLIEMQDGSMLEYEITDGVGSVQPSDSGPLLEPCPWICAIKNVSAYSHEEDLSDHNSRLVFGLSAKSRLYFHDMMLTDSASSLFLSMEHEFLCYATAGSRCQIRFLPLYELTGFDPLMGLDQLHVLEGYEPRNVERGARLVAIIPSQPMAVLQMPRGNLEGIYPRALVLRFVMIKINAGEYGEAFHMMRKHKVDLNLVVDLDPLNFLEVGITSFFKQVENIDHLNLFISSLREWDITASRFPVPDWFSRDKQIKDRTSFDFSTKVSQVCSKARSTMLDMEASGQKIEGHFLLPVLSTFAKETPPRLDEALGLIKDTAMKNPPQSNKNPLFGDKAQNSIHYLAFLAEYELLFETALGMYDYDIARAVARNSQMDPRVYLPLLKRLNSLPIHYGRFEVDIRLKRYESALRNLYTSLGNKESFQQQGELETEEALENNFENCLTLIDEHNLYRLGLELFKSDSEKRHLIFVSLGEHLMKEKQYQTALSVFLAAEPVFLDGAKRAARAACDWRCFFSLSEEVSGLDASNGSPENLEIKAEQRRQLARDVAGEVIAEVGPEPSKKRQEAYSGGAHILLDYGDDLLGATEMFLKGYCWSEAHRVALLHSRQDLVKKCVDAAVSYAYTAMDDFEDKINTFTTTNERYAEVLKLRKQNVFIEGPDPAEDDETGSLFSAASNYSNMSLQSATSNTSISSGVSSVISVKTSTTFTMTGDDGINRHRSKFNKGKKEKKRKKKRKARRKPGSVEELNGLVQTLRLCVAGDEYSLTVAETIRFLIFADQLALASEVYNRFQVMVKSIDTSRANRVETTLKEKTEAQNKARMEGEQDDTNYVLIELPIEKEIDSLACADLPESLSNFFGYTS